METGPKFEVRYDHDRRLLSWAMRDFWSMGDVEAFKTALNEAIKPLGPPPYIYDELCDSTAFPVQSPEVSAALGRIKDVGTAMRSGRTAVVVGSIISKLQVQRTLIDPDLRVFLSLEEATAWLNCKRTA